MERKPRLAKRITRKYAYWDARSRGLARKAARGHAKAVVKREHPNV